MSKTLKILWILIKKYYPILCIVGLALIVFNKIVFHGQVYYTTDDFHLNIPQKYFFVDQILHGSFPLWNPYLFTGIPHFADFNLGTLFPLNFLYFLFPVPRALSVQTCLDIVLIGIFQYVFLRTLKISKIVSLLGAIVFAFSGTIFLYVTNNTFLNVLVFVPLLFYFTYKLIREKKYSYFLILILLQTLQLLSGHPQGTYYTILFISFYLFFFSKFSLKQKIFMLIMYYVFILVLSSFQMLPFIEYVLHANRPLTNLDYASWASYGVSNLITVFFPTFFGTYLEGTWWGSQSMILGYVGIPSLVFLIYGFMRGKVIHKVFFIWSFVLSCLLMVGKVSPVYLLFYYLVPGWRFFRASSGLIVFATFFATIIICTGFEYLLQNPQKFIEKFQKILLPTSLLFVIGTIGFFIIDRQKSFWQRFLTLLFHTTHIHIFERVLIYDRNKLQVMFQGMLSNILLALFFLLLSLFLFLFFSKNKKLLAISFIIFISATLVYFDQKVLLTSSINLYNTNLPVPSILKDAQTGEYRILSLPVDLHQHREYLAIPDFFYKESLANLNIYFGDNNIERKLYQAQGYTSLVPDSYAIFIAGKKSAGNVTGIDFANITQRQLSMASIKYILFHESLSSFPAQVTLVASKKDKYYIYENPNVHSRAYTLFGNGSKNVQFIKNTPTDIIVDAYTPAPNLLILTDWYYPGWVAYVNGQEETIEPFANTFRSVSIPQGNSRIRFVYDPLSFRIGITLSAIGICVVFVLFLFRRNQNI